MKYQKFEQHIADSLSKDTMDLDINALIQDIHGQKPKRRVVGFWWIVASAVVVTGGLLYLVMENSKASTSSATSSKATIAQSVAAERHMGTSLFLEKKGENPDALQNIATKTKVKTQLNKLSKEGNNYSNFNTKSSNQSSSKTQEDGKVTFSSDSKSSKSEGPISFQEKIETVNTLKRASEDISSLNVMDVSALHSIKNLGINPRKVVCPDFSNKTKFDIAISPEVGIFLPLKTLENGGSEFENVFRLRSNNENSLEGIYAGIYAQVSTPKYPFYLKTGLSWSKMTEKMKLDFEYTKKDTTQGIISITYSQNGDTITAIIGDIITERRFSGSKTRHYQFQLWDLPIGIGYEQSFGKWYGSVEAGVHVNLSNRTSGSILQSDTSFIEIGKPVQHFKTQLGLSYFAGIQIGRWVHPSGRIYLSTRFRMIPDAFSTTSNTVKQQYHFLGLNLGYSHMF